MSLDVVGMEEIRRLLPDHLLRLETYQVLDGRADVPGRAVGVGDQDRIERVFQKHPEELQFLLHALPLGLATPGRIRWSPFVGRILDHALTSREIFRRLDPPPRAAPILTARPTH